MTSTITISCCRKIGKKFGNNSCVPLGLVDIGVCPSITPIVVHVVGACHSDGVGLGLMDRDERLEECTELTALTIVGRTPRVGGGGGHGGGRDGESLTFIHGNSSQNTPLITNLQP